MTNTFAKRMALAVTASAVIALAPSTAHAGFLDQLFGGGGYQQSPLQAPSSGGYSYDNPDPNLGYAPARRAQSASRKRAVTHVAAVEKTPNLQKTTDIMHDKTLRPGDAVMMKTGLHVYDGPKASRHDSDEFVALDKADVSKKTRSELAAMDATHRAPANFIASNVVQEGRSSSGQPITQGYKITDSQGHSIRYVGP